MKTSKSGYWIGLGWLIFFLTGCGSASAQSSPTVPSTQFITSTAAPTATIQPTKVVPTWTVSPTLPASLLTPVAATVAAHPLALNAFNAGAEMKLVKIYGAETWNNATFDNVQTAMIFLNGEQKYAAALQNERQQVDLVDPETGALLQTYALPNSKIRGFAFHPDGKIVATLDDNNMLALWDIQSQHIIYQITLSEYVESPFTFSPDGLSAFFKNPDGNILNFDFLNPADLNNNGRNYYTYNYPDSFFQNNYHFNRAGHLVLFGINSNSPEFRDVKTDQKITLPFEIVSSKQYMEIEAFAISADGKFLAFGSTTGIYVWNLETMKQISILSGHELEGRDGWIGRISDLFFSPQSNLLVSVGHDGTTRLWDIHTGRQLRLLDVCCSATFTADGRYLLAAHNGTLRVWGIPNRP